MIKYVELIVLSIFKLYLFVYVKLWKNRTNRWKTKNFVHDLMFVRSVYENVRCLYVKLLICLFKMLFLLRHLFTLSTRVHGIFVLLSYILIYLFRCFSPIRIFVRFLSLTFMRYKIDYLFNNLRSYYLPQN